MTISWKHDDLAEDLAIAKGGIPYLNVCLGSAWCNFLNRDNKTPRADLVVCRPSYSQFTLSVFEIKISRADFLSDIRSEKWRSYLPHCHRFYFAVAAGVATKDDIPAEAGFMVRGPKGWTTRKAAPPQSQEIPPQTLLSLIFAKQRRSTREKRLDDVIAMQQDKFSRQRKDFSGRLKAARVLGDEVGKLHEAAMGLGGLKESTELLQCERERRLREALKKWSGVNTRL